MPVAIVTGGSRGIGLGIARELAKAGCRLVINGLRDESMVGQVMEELRGDGVEVCYARGDVADKQARQGLLAATLERYGQVNILVNNAGIAPRERRDLLEATEESFEQVLKVNLQGPYFLTQMVAHQMIRQKQLHSGMFCCIVNVSSVSARVASVNRGEYCISKAGIAMATKLWASRLGEFDIPVYEIQPGVIRTDMTAGAHEKYDRWFAQGLAIQERWGTPEDVGKVAAAMATGALAYSTGQVVLVDGGMTVQRL